MTATERLRQLLDERGVEWIDFDGEPTWMGNDRMHYARQECSCDEPTDEVTVYHLTPEQAVEATLGRGTCKMEATLTNPFETRIDEYHCSECGEYCSVEKVMGKTEPPKFCPECGRKVES